MKEFLGSAYNDYNLVIALENGNPVESRIVRDRFTTLCEEHNFEVVVFHSLRHLSTKYKLKMTHGDIKSVQGDTGHAEAEMVTDVYSEIVDEDRRLNAKKLDEEFYDTLDTEEPEHNHHSEAQEPTSDNDKLLLELLKSMTPEMKEKLLKERQRGSPADLTRGERDRGPRRFGIYNKLAASSGVGKELEAERTKLREKLDKVDKSLSLKNNKGAEKDDLTEEIKDR